MRKAAISCGVVGLILLVCGGLLAWWITPSYVAQLPGNYNKTRTYDGTIHTLFNPAALASGNLAAAIKTNLPGKLTENVKVLNTSGSSALLRDTRTVDASGSVVARITSRYSVNRKSLAATAPHPSSWRVVPATGLTVSWPLGAKRHDYTGWVPLTETTTTLRYTRQVKQGGINTYEYRATVPATPIKNAQVLASLPRSLPTSLVPSLQAAGILSASEVSGLSAAFPHATSIPLAYTYQATDTYFVAPASGLVVNVSNNETETGAIALPTGKLIPVVPVLADSYHASPSSLSSAVSDANSAGGAITALGVALPIALASIGFLLVLLAVLLWLRKPSRGRPVDTGYDQRHPSPAGRIT